MTKLERLRGQSGPRRAIRGVMRGFTLVRHTIAKRMRAKLFETKEMLNRMRYPPVPEQGRWLGPLMRGYFAYHGPCRPMRGRSRPFTTMSCGTGDARWRAAARKPPFHGGG